MTTFFIALDCNIPQVLRNICKGIGGFLFLLNFFQTKAKGDFLNPKIHRFCKTIKYLSIGVCFIHILLDLIYIQGNETYFIVLGVVDILIYFITGNLTQLKQIKQGNIVDFTEESRHNFEAIKTQQAFYSLLLFGFQISDLVCLSWKLN
jgi:hypothetical protein